MKKIPDSITYLAGVARSGTSWLGQIFDSSPEVRYSFQPLFSYEFKNRVNENVTTSTTLWSIIFLFPFSILFEAPWNASPTIESTLSLLYLGVIATGLAWLIRFRILTVNGLVFQTQVAYLIPIFGIFFGYFLMDEIITWKVIASLVVILIGIYIFKKNNKGLVR